MSPEVERIGRQVDRMRRGGRAPAPWAARIGDVATSATRLGQGALARST
jgi:hypothetical protein